MVAQQVPETDRAESSAPGAGQPLVWLTTPSALPGLAEQLAHSDLPLATGERGVEPPDSVRVVVGLPTAVGPLTKDRPGVAGVAVARHEGEARCCDGVDFLLRWPVDAAALRLLLLHLIGPGVERRVARRVPVRGPVRLITGLFSALWPRRATLLELSAGGALVSFSRPLAEGRRVALRLPSGLGGRGRRFLVGRALRSTPDEEEGHQISVAFTGLSLRSQARIRALLAARDPLGDPSRVADLSDLEVPALELGSEPERGGEPELDLEETDAEVAERRLDSRHSYANHVIARGLERPRVLLGRDLSLGGMRVDPDPDLPVGTELQVAVHVRAGVTPLVLTARVERDDGEDGLFLGFRNPTEVQHEYLSGMLGLLPTLDERGKGVVVTEVLDDDRAVA